MDTNKTTKIYEDKTECNKKGLQIYYWLEDKGLDVDYSDNGPIFYYTFENSRDYENAIHLLNAYCGRKAITGTDNNRLEIRIDIPTAYTRLKDSVNSKYMSNESLNEDNDNEFIDSKVDLLLSELKKNDLGNNVSERILRSDVERYLEGYYSFDDFLYEIVNNTIEEYGLDKDYDIIEGKLKVILQKLNLKDSKDTNLNESPDRYGLETDDEIENAYQSAVDDADKQRRHAYDDRDNIMNKYILKVDLSDESQGSICYINKNYWNENPIASDWENFVTDEKDLNNVNDLLIFDTEAEALEFRDNTEYDIWADEVDAEEIESMYYPIQIKDLYKNESLNEANENNKFTIKIYTDTEKWNSEVIDSLKLKKNKQALNAYKNVMNQVTSLSKHELIHRGIVKNLQSTLPKMYEIKWNINRVQYRIVCKYDDKDTLYLLVPFIKSNGDKDTDRAVATAEKRFKSLTEDVNYFQDLNITMLNNLIDNLIKEADEDNTVEGDEDSITEELLESDKVEDDLEDIIRDTIEENSNENTKIRLFEITTEPENPTRKKEEEKMWVVDFDDMKTDFRKLTIYPYDEEKPYAPVASFMLSGGLNGSGNWTDYLDDLQKLFEKLKEATGLEPLIYEESTDIADDVWDAKVFMYDHNRDEEESNEEGQVETIEEGLFNPEEEDKSYIRKDKDGKYSLHSWTQWTKNIGFHVFDGAYDSLDELYSCKPWARGLEVRDGIDENLNDELDEEYLYATAPKELQDEFENGMKELGWSFDENTRNGSKYEYEPWDSDLVNNAKNIHYQYVSDIAFETKDELNSYMDKTFKLIEELEDKYNCRFLFSGGLITEGDFKNHESLALDLKPIMYRSDEGPTPQYPGHKLMLDKGKPVRDSDKAFIKDISNKMNMDADEILNTMSDANDDDEDPLDEDYIDETYSRDELDSFKNKVFNQQKIMSIYKKKKYGKKRLMCRVKCTNCGRQKKLFLSNLVTNPEKYGSCICSDKNINARYDTINGLYKGTKKLKNNTSGYTGVSWVAKYRGEPYNKWRAYIDIDGKRNYLGDFSSKSKAIRARKAAAAKGLKWYAENKDQFMATSRRNRKRKRKLKNKKSTTA